MTNAQPTTVNGKVTVTYVAPQTAQTVNVTAVVGSVSGSATFQVAAGAGTIPGDGSLTTPEFGDNTYADAVFDGGTIEELAAAVTAAGGTSVWVSSNGVYYRYNTLATGATAFVNNAFNAAFADGIVGPNAVFVVK